MSFSWHAPRYCGDGLGSLALYCLTNEPKTVLESGSGGFSTSIYKKNDLEQPQYPELQQRSTVISSKEFLRVKSCKLQRKTKKMLLVN